MFSSLKITGEMSLKSGCSVQGSPLLKAKEKEGCQPFSFSNEKETDSHEKSVK